MSEGSEGREHKRKHKIVLMPVDEVREKAKRDIVVFIEKRWGRGVRTNLQDVRDVFEKKPYDLSSGTVRNYLDDLILERKLSERRDKMCRYFEPFFMPLPIKVGVGVGLFIVVFCTLLDIVLPSDLVDRFVYLKGFSSVSMLPVIIYCLLVTVFFTVFWHLNDRKVYK